MIFIKQNPSIFADALYREAQGLACLRGNLQKTTVHTRIAIPEVIDVNEQKLTLQAINTQTARPEQLQQLGMALATLHQIPQPFYGFPNDNYIGLNPQPNGRFHHWGDFFLQQRLQFQVSLIHDNQRQEQFQQILAQHGSKLADFLSTHCQQASLLHGDLWHSNVLFDNERAWLIDPAVYYGDREADLAMTEMFGGFSPQFYQAYAEQFPLTGVYPQKKILYNLYHYLNHYNLFGQAYLPGCEQGFRLLEAL